MRYDLVVVGMTPAARREALTVSRRNRLVAIVRTRPAHELIFEEPLESWDFSQSLTWSRLREQFSGHAADIDRQLALEGIDVLQGQMLLRSADSFVVESRAGEAVELQADSVLFSAGKRVSIPQWMRAELPGIITLEEIPQLDRLPAAVIIEGMSLPALRAASILTKFKTEITMIEHPSRQIDPFDGEAKELRELLERNGARFISAPQIQCIACPVPGEFLIESRNGDRRQVSSYIYAENSLGNEGRLGLSQLGALTNQSIRVDAAAHSDSARGADVPESYVAGRYPRLMRDRRSTALYGSDGDSYE